MSDIPVYINRRDEYVFLGYGRSEYLVDRGVQYVLIEPYLLKKPIYPIFIIDACSDKHILGEAFIDLDGIVTVRLKETIKDAIYNLFVSERPTHYIVAIPDVDCEIPFRRTEEFERGLRRYIENHHD